MAKCIAIFLPVNHPLMTSCPSSLLYHFVCLQISPIKALFSIPQSPFLLPSQPLLASTALQLDKSSMPSPLQSTSLEDTSDHRLRYDYSKVSPVSHVSLSHSSAKSSSPSRVRGNTSAALAVAHKIEVRMAFQHFVYNYCNKEKTGGKVSSEIVEWYSHRYVGR